MRLRTAAPLLLALTLVLSAAAQERPAQPAADWMTQRPAVYSVVLQVERGVNRNDRGIDAKMAAAVCESSSVVDPVLIAVTQMPIELVRPLMVVDAEPTNDTFVTLKVTLSPQAKDKLTPDVGGKILGEIAKRAAAVLAKSAEAQMAPLRDQRDALDKRLAEAVTQLDQAEAKYRDAAGKIDLTGRAGGVYDPRPDLEHQRLAVIRDLSAARARLATYQATKATTQPAGLETEAAAIGRQLSEKREKKYVEVRTAVEHGTATPADLEAADDRLLEAQLWVAMIDQRRIPVGRAELQGQDEAMLRGNLAALEAQVASFDEQLAALPKPSTKPADVVSQNDFQLITSDRNEARNRVQQLRQQRDSFDQQFGTLRPPTITPLTAE